MSLFPAYKNRAAATEEIEVASSSGAAACSDWLANSSFRNAAIPPMPKAYGSSGSSVGSTRSKNAIPVSSDSDSDGGSSRVVRKQPKPYKPKIRVKTLEYVREVARVYFEDKRREPMHHVWETLPPKARGVYHMLLTSLGFRPHDFQQKKEVLARYFHDSPFPEDILRKPDGVIKRGAPIPANREDYNVLPLVECVPNAEEEQKTLTREFNEKLARSPHDVDLWLRYLKFHDVTQRFERCRITANEAALCQKKLAVVEKALERNSDSKELLREKLRLMGELHPADQFMKQIEALVNKDTGNIMLWQAFVMVVQSSVAMCTVPKIVDMYTKCFGTLRLWSVATSRTRDERLLEMMYHCFIFLRQAGLWEQMWEALRMNLIFNLSLAKDSLRFQSSIDEKKLIELEEVILTSRLPLNQLWLRVESLREHCHWISVSRDQWELIGDSHRFVSPEDITDFVHPMQTRDSNLRLAVFALMTLKVPLLPTSDSILMDLGLEKCSWTIDSIEALLPMLYPMVGELAGHEQRKQLLKGLLNGGLTSGPQYLTYHPAQEPYLDFVRDTFRVIAESLSPTQRTSLYVWWLRFERMLVYVCKDEPKSDNRRKKLKGLLKEFLKKEENRYNLYFYREYALIEREMGRHESCVNILETAIGSATTATEEDRRILLSLQRTLIEVLLDARDFNEDNRARANEVLCRIVPTEEPVNDIAIAEAYLRSRFTNFLAEPSVEQNATMDTHFLPIPVCDEIACYAYLLYANDRDVSEISSVFDDCLEHTKSVKYLHERFYENKIAILQAVNQKLYGFYHTYAATLKDALECHPNNFYLLSVLAGVESELPNWKLGTRNESGKPWQDLALCLARRARIHSFITRDMTTAATAAINKLICFHRSLARSPESRHCPLIWRLQMLLLREQALSQERGEGIYHESVAQCPWSRRIYIDAAEVAPQLLTQIQDVIREKDLRMHVTPEELDILRG